MRVLLAKRRGSTTARRIVTYFIGQGSVVAVASDACDCQQVMSEAGGGCLPLYVYLAQSTASEAASTQPDPISYQDNIREGASICFRSSMARLI